MMRKRPIDRIGELGPVFSKSDVEPLPESTAKFMGNDNSLVRSM